MSSWPTPPIAPPIAKGIEGGLGILCQALVVSALSFSWSVACAPHAPIPDTLRSFHHCNEWRFRNPSVETRYFIRPSEDQNGRKGRDHRVRQTSSSPGLL